LSRFASCGGAGSEEGLESGKARREFGPGQTSVVVKGLQRGGRVFGQEKEVLMPAISLRFEGIGGFLDLLELGGKGFGWVFPEEGVIGRSDFLVGAIARQVENDEGIHG